MQFDNLRADESVFAVDDPEGPGNYYEDMQVGAVFRHALGRTVLEADNAWFTLLTMNTNELHFNRFAAKQSEHRRIIVNSGLTVALVLGLSVQDLSQNAIANLGWRYINLISPIFVGDTLYAESIVLSTRDSASRPAAGIVTCFTRGLNQDGTEVLNFERSILLPKRIGGPVRPFPKAKVPITRRTRSST